MREGLYIGTSLTSIHWQFSGIPQPNQHLSFDWFLSQPGKSRGVLWVQAKSQAQSPSWKHQAKCLFFTLFDDMYPLLVLLYLICVFVLIFFLQVSKRDKTWAQKEHLYESVQIQPKFFDLSFYFEPNVWSVAVNECEFGWKSTGLALTRCWAASLSLYRLPVSSL